MQLASLDGGGGGSTATGGASGTQSSGDADLRISSTPWTSASGVADELRTDTNSGLADLKEADAGLASGTKGWELFSNKCQ